MTILNRISDDPIQRESDLTASFHIRRLLCLPWHKVHASPNENKHECAMQVAHAHEVLLCVLLVLANIGWLVELQVGRMSRLQVLRRFLRWSGRRWGVRVVGVCVDWVVLEGCSLLDWLRGLGVRRRLRVLWWTWSSGWSEGWSSFRVCTSLESWRSSFVSGSGGRKFFLLENWVCLSYLYNLHYFFYNSMIKFLYFIIISSPYEKFEY